MMHHCLSPPADFRNLAWACLALSGCPAPAIAEPNLTYPFVFTSTAELEELGLSLDWPTPAYGETFRPPHFKNGCYLYYGQDRDHLISVSDEFLARYTSKGFSRESLCLALVSGARFDPETGARLPTYVLRDDAVLDKQLEDLAPAKMTADELSNYVPGIFPSKDALIKAIERLKKREFTGLDELQASLLVPSNHHTYELPLQVPPCFKNGTPLLDCNWKYGLMSGRLLSAQAPKRYHEVGVIADRQIRDQIASGQGRRPYDQSEAYYIESAKSGSYLLFDRLVDLPEPNVDRDESYILELKIADELIEWAGPIAWYATSPSLPRGYGYALYAWSAFSERGGPSVSVATLRAAFDGDKWSTRVNLKKLKDILE